MNGSELSFQIVLFALGSFICITTTQEYLEPKLAKGVRMKVRDSGMPDEEMWTGFFDPSKVLEVLGVVRGVQDLVEFGCGYGTFTLAAAGIASGTVHALDIEPEMVEGKCGCKTTPS